MEHIPGLDVWMFLAPGICVIIYVHIRLYFSKKGKMRYLKIRIIKDKQMKVNITEEAEIFSRSSKKI